MKRWFAYMVLLWLVSVMPMQAVPLTSSDPYWLGDDPTFGTTEGDDFWLTFMNNAMFNPAEENLQDITFELKIAVSARQQTHINVYIGSTYFTDFQLNANETRIVNITPDKYPDVYLWLSETRGYKGVHVYTDEEGKKFSCFNYSRNGEAGESSRDATLIVPTKELGYEYYVQTYYEDTYSSEFAVVATEANTQVRIWPAYNTFSGITAGTMIPLTLSQGEAYLVASAQHQASATHVDLSGSLICADKPIAVFNGNQQTSIPYHESNSKDYLSEQIIPYTQWGMDFYLAKLGGTKENYTVLTAAYDDTYISISYYIPGYGTEVFLDTLSAGESTEPLPLSAQEITEMVIHSSAPIMCYDYTTSGGQNEECTGAFTNKICVKYGDPANALMPSWAHRVRSMNFFTHDLDPYVAPGKQEPPKKYFVYLVTSSENKGNITVDGVTLPATSYTDFQGDATKCYISYELPTLTSSYHVIESSAEGFVGMVYALTDAQGYLYTLGYTPDPYRDSLFVTNSENLMSGKSYDLPQIDQGWYQRQWEEWAPGHERLDTVVVCDSSVVNWLIQTPIVKQTDPVDWYIYDVTGTEPAIDKPYLNPEESVLETTKTSTTSTDWLYNWSYQFTLPDESDREPKMRTPFKDYEVHAVLHKKHVICDLPDELDTMRTVVRVTRIYHDTIFQNICMGDSLIFFYDSLPNQGNLNIVGSQADSTMFIGDKTDGESTVDWQWKARAGENIYRREYQTIFGCDSTYTLFLFVCDTFRVVDTVHLCTNEKITIQPNASISRTYKGIEATGDGTLVTQDTVDIIEAKTQFCGCQLDPRYPPFEGCDSLLEMHIFLHEIYRDTIVDTMCYNRNPDSAYVWPIQNNTKQLLITKDDPRMHLDPKLQAWIGYFSDTLRTTSCPECNEGKGCDSIQVLKLIIPKAYYFEEQVEECAWTYDPVTRDTTRNVYQWKKHRNGAAYVELPDPGDYYDSLQTRFGCDSIYHLKLIYHEPFMEVTQHTIPNNQSYVWRGRTYGPYPEIQNDTVLYFHDITIDAHGCQRIYRLDLNVSNTYLFDETRTICDNDSVHWRGKIIVGNKWTGTDDFDKRMASVGSAVIFDSLLTTQLPVRDSVYMLTVFQYPTYEKTLNVLSFCQTDQGYQWKRKDNGQLIEDIVFPVKDHYPFDTIYTARLQTKNALGCDSVVHLPIVIYPVYDTLVVDSLCEKEMPYIWQLKDKQGSHNRTIHLPADKKGKGWHYTSQYTLHTVNGCDSVVHLDLTVKQTTTHEYSVTRCANEGPYPYGDKGKTASVTGTYTDTLSIPNHYGCDSVIILHLQVNPVYAFTTDTAICQNESFAWLNHTGPANHIKDASGQTVSVIPTNRTGLFEYTDSLRTAAGCDSIWTLRLRVDTVYTSPVSVTSRSMCENDTLHFYDKVLYGAKSPLKPTGIAGFGVPEGQYTYSFDTTFTDHTILGCDSAVMHHITVFPTRNHLTVDTVCLDTVHIRYDWGGHGQVEVYQNRVGTRTYVDSLHSSHSDCACDSIFELQLTVLPSYHKHFTHTMSEEEVYTWEHVTYGGVKATDTHDIVVTGDTVIAMYYQTENVGSYQCDSILQLSLRLGQVTRDTTHRYVCADEASFVWQRANKDGVMETRKTISGSNLPDVRQHKLYYDSLKTNLGFDSIFVLDLYRAPTYAYDASAHVCQYSPFVWNDHDGPTNNVMDAAGLPVTDIPTDHHGVFYYYDRLVTDSFGCDSIWTLRLYVDSVYAFTTDTAICQNESFVWLNHTGPANHIKDASGQTVSVIPTNRTGLFEYTDSLRTAVGCDSTWTLRLRVDTVYTSPVSVTSRSMCENDTLHFYDKVLYGAKSPLKPTGIAGFGVPEGQNSYSFDTTFTDHTIFGCDSAVIHHITVFPTYEKVYEDSVCQGSAYSWLGHNSEFIWDVRQQKRIRLTEIPTAIKSGVTYTYIDSLHTTACPECRQGAGGCDSIWTLHLRVDSVYYHADTITMSDEESRKWQHTVYIGSKVNADTLSATWFEGESQQQIVRIPDGLIVNAFDTVYPTIHHCDSTIHLRLLVGITYRDTIEGWTCDNEPYHWYHAGDSLHEARPDIEILEPKLYYDSLRTVEFGFDSIYVLNLHNYPTYHFSFTDTVCQGSPYHWEGHTESDQFYAVEYGRWVHRDAIPTGQSGYFTFIDSLKTHEPELHPNQNRHSGCDSVWTLNLYIPPAYHFYDTIPLCENDSAHWQGMLFTGSQFTAYGKTYTPGPFDSIKVDLPHGTYHVDIRRPTIFACDSVYHLTLNVHEVAHTDSVDSICQGSPFFNPNWNRGQGRFMPTERVGTYVSVDTIPSVVSGCDSIVTLTLRVDSVYQYGIAYTFCQDTVDTMREWIDEEGVSHGFVLDVSKAGDFEQRLHFTTIHGCDSSYGVTWHVNPIYRFDSTYVICQDDRVEWQGKSYAGDKYGWGFERLSGDRYDTHRDSVYYHYLPGDSILTPGVYYDTAHYYSKDLCDSTYYLQLIVHPAGHYIRNEVACDNEKYHVFYSTDAYGEHTDTVFFSRSTRMINETQRDTMCFEMQRRLTAIDGGCDSTIHFHLTVHPAYEYVTRVKLCWDETYEWRGNSYFGAGVYYDSISGGTDYWGCDSVYVLELFKKPLSLIPMYDTICDDVTYEHLDTLWYTNGTHSLVETMVWKPGMTIPQSYTDVIFKGVDGCDSIIYRYYLQINKTYLTNDTADICSSRSHITAEHIYTGYECEYDTDVYILPYDTLIRDAYSSVHGCDSVYQLYATVCPTYRHIDTITVCDNETAAWRAHQYSGLKEGEHIFRDSLATVLGCDSIYELHLMVKPTYLFPDTLSKCADEDMTWHGQILDHLPVGDHFFYDSLSTVTFGCDSVYHLYLTVNDTTSEVRYDTICRTEIYDLHGKPITEPGYYYDTTLNEWGCHHYTHLYLEVIEPTVPTVWAGTICADNNAYELYCTYTGRDPIGFSLYYDEDGHANGFVDIIDSTIYDLSELYPLSLPMPNIGEDRTNYPRPDYYNIKLVLHNGICTNQDLCSTDTNVVLSYPSWLTHQRFGDVIALYNEKYNGGYQWDHYQWYHGDSLLPGETHEYLYVPEGLIVGDQYHVRLTREGETGDDRAFQTCPITIIEDPINNDYAPNMGYLSAVPTCICPGNPYIHILARHPGTYRIITNQGAFVSEGVFTDDATPVEVPHMEGLYIILLWSYDTPEEPTRSIKFVVSTECCSLLYENIPF